jgi:Tfp pilus assembly protein PilF
MLREIGKMKEEKKEYIDAVEFLKESIEKDPNNPEPYHKLAEIFLILKEVDKAIHYAIECSKYKQNDADLSNLIGLCYLQKVK